MSMYDDYLLSEAERHMRGPRLTRDEAEDELFDDAYEGYQVKAEIKDYVVNGKYASKEAFIQKLFEIVSCIEENFNERMTEDGLRGAA